MRELAALLQRIYPTLPMEQGIASVDLHTIGLPQPPPMQAAQQAPKWLEIIFAPVLVFMMALPWILSIGGFIAVLVFACMALHFHDFRWWFYCVISFFIAVRAAVHLYHIKD